VDVGTWRWNEHELRYEVYGEGPRTLIYIHGLLLPARCNRPLAREIAGHGHRVILPELLGHGGSSAPRHATDHRLDFMGQQVVSLLDHLGLDQAIVGGVSLGANVTLQVAADAPNRLRGAVIEMPVLERGGVAGTGLFLPLLLGFRYLRLPSRLGTALLRHAPRTGVDAVDAFLDAGSGDPRVMAAILHGLAFGSLAPGLPTRQAIQVPSLVIGHPRDLLHPMDDARMLVEELPDSRLVRAGSIAEARTRPRRLAGEIAAFMDERWRPQPAATQADGAT
jgi:pimeloyl-ACP methyl ester carboxylesterase